MIRFGNLYQTGLPAFDINEGHGWRRSVLYRSSTRNMDWIGIHVSRLEPDAAPHSVETHQEEELVVVLDGELQLSLYDSSASSSADRTELLRPGDMVFHPSRQHHGQMSKGSEAAIYATFKWRAPDRTVDPPAQGSLSSVWRGSATRSTGEGLHRSAVFDMTTRWLGNLHCHRSFLPPGVGYKPHADRHDVALVVLEGEFQSSEMSFGPGSVLFHPAGLRHGLHNASSEACLYYAVEFHGRPRATIVSGLQYWVTSTIRRAAAKMSASR